MTHQKTIDALINLIINAQQPNGSFLSLSSADKEFKVSRPYRTTFTTSIIISLISQLPKNVPLENAIKKGRDYLLSQKSPQWSWNYWDRNSSEAKTDPYPDDLDDTFCALTALSHADRRCIDGKALSLLTQLLTRLEVTPGGPYKTWVTEVDPTNQWSDIDIAVNCNIAYFLKRERISLSGLDAYIEKTIESGKISSKYYPSPYPILFYISRFYKGKYIPHLVKILEKSATQELDEALRILSLLNFGVSSQKIHAAITLLSKHTPQPRPFCIDPSKNNRTMYNGSKALTASFMCLTLFLYQERTGKNKLASHSVEEAEIIAQVKKEANQRIVRFPLELKRSVNELLIRTVNCDLRQEIILVPFWWNVSLGEKAHRLCVSLGVINLFGWIAYRVYDDVLDNDGRSRHLTCLLPLANILHSEILILYRNILPKKYWSIFNEVLRKIEYANFWEQTHCRLDIGKKISLKELPHFGDLSIIAEALLHLWLVIQAFWRSTEVWISCSICVYETKES